MSAIIYGTTGSVTPSFNVTFDETGAGSGSVTLILSRGDYDQSNYKNGTTLQSIYPAAPFDAIINGHQYSEKPGGLDEVTVNFESFTADVEAPERNTTYDYQVDLAEKPIIEHPKFAQVYPPNQELLVKYYEGKVRVVDIELNPYKFIDNYSGQILRDYEPSSGSFGQDFYDVIVKNGIKTYLQPTAEYTESKTDQGGVIDQIDNMGKIDTPPGDPPTIPDTLWFLSGASQSVSYDAPITYSRTWTSIDDTAANNFLYGS
jgi:hypothetical protein